MKEQEQKKTMMYDKKRFEIVHREGNGFTNPNITILVDRETGVNYLYTSSGYSGGLTPLLDENGKPIITRNDR